jgi:hypothetical protein
MSRYEGMGEYQPDAVKQTLERERLQELLLIKSCYVLNWIFKSTFTNVSARKSKKRKDLGIDKTKDDEPSLLNDPKTFSQNVSFKLT